MRRRLAEDEVWLAAADFYGPHSVNRLLSWSAPTRTGTTGGRGVLARDRVMPGLVAGVAGSGVFLVLAHADAVTSALVRGGVRRPCTTPPGPPPSGEADPRAAPGRSGRGASGTACTVAAGLGAGVLTSFSRGTSFWVDGLVGDALSGALMKVLGAGAAVLIGAGEPGKLTPAGWVADGIPHLAYGLATRATVGSLSRRGSGPALRPPSVAVLSRALLLGVGVGSRSALGVAGPELSTRPSSRVAVLGQLAAAALLSRELVFDKRPSTSSRLAAAPLAARVIGGGLGGAVLARRGGTASLGPVAVGALGATAGAGAGSAWRTWAARRGPDWRGALAEDAVALGLSFLAHSATDRRTAGWAT